MKILFNLGPGDESLHLDYVWRLEVSDLGRLREHFIPEPYFDYLWAETGGLDWRPLDQENWHPVPNQALKSLFSGPIELQFRTPLILWGARFNLAFAETREDGLEDVRGFARQDWWNAEAPDLASFAHQMTPAMVSKSAATRILNAQLSITPEFSRYSARHQRRQFRKTFGISRQDLERILNVQAFLAQTCDFGSENPRIIDYVNDAVFYDQPHLNRTFKRMTGLSPLEYFERQSLLQDNLMAASYNVNREQ
jgi:AraC-like DNA-binding protein